MNNSIRLPDEIKTRDLPPRIRTAVSRIDITLVREHDDWFRQLWGSLVRSKAKLADGTPVQGKTEVLQWLLEQAFLPNGSS